MHPHRLVIINGPNLNLLGKREPEVYGNLGFEDYLNTLKTKFPTVSFDYFQSNIEGELIDAIQKFGFTHDGIVLNAAAYTHTSVGIGDAVKAVPARVVEVHISNTFAREDFRHVSYISAHAVGVILGFGLDGYELAVEGLLKKL
jgi:3-dehydroquinate dehydratase-2